MFVFSFTNHFWNVNKCYEKYDTYLTIFDTMIPDKNGIAATWMTKKVTFCVLNMGGGWVGWGPLFRASSYNTFGGGGLPYAIFFYL